MYVHIDNNADTCGHSTKVPVKEDKMTYIYFKVGAVSMPVCYVVSTFHFKVTGHLLSKLSSLQ